MACHDDRMHTSVKHTHNYYVICQFMLTSRDDLLGRQPTPTKDEEGDPCPQNTREVPEGSGVCSQTRYVQAIVTRLLTSQAGKDGDLGAEDPKGTKAGCGAKLGKEGELLNAAAPAAAKPWEKMKEMLKTPNTPINPQGERRGTSSPKI